LQGGIYGALISTQQKKQTKKKTHPGKTQLCATVVKKKQINITPAPWKVR
jgi:hypothetical protein